MLGSIIYLKQFVVLANFYYVKTLHTAMHKSISLTKNITSAQATY